MPNSKHTSMFAEAAEASVVAEFQHRLNAPLMVELARNLRALQPRVIFTCARGSSDHAATFGKYLIETRLGIPVVSQAPSISSIYGAPLQHMRDQPFILISQSGRSPDLLLCARAARQAGALVIAFVNEIGAPLAEIAEIVVPLHAGPEKSVAATKSYIATLCALHHLTAEWAADSSMQKAVETLPEVLAKAWANDWSAGVDLFRDAQSMFVLGRGLTLGVAQEAALKFKETSGIHAEAFSIAEVVHGPMALVKSGFPLLIFPPFDQPSGGLDPVVFKFLDRHAKIAVVGLEYKGALSLAMQTTLHVSCIPIAMAQSFYAMVNSLSIARGYDPDRPPMLQKVTETI